MAAGQKPPVKMERRDVRITIRYTESEAERLTAHAHQRGEEVSRHIRRASLMGDTMLEHQEMLQKQGQLQLNQPNQTVAPSQSVKIDVDVPRQSPAVVPPALTSAGQNVCLGSFSVGVSVYGAGAAFGKTTTDKGCERRNNAALLYQFGQPNAALRLLMLDEEVSEALNPTRKKAAAIEEMLAPLVNRPWEASVRREGP